MRDKEAFQEYMEQELKIPEIVLERMEHTFELLPDRKETRTTQEEAEVVAPDITVQKQGELFQNNKKLRRKYQWKKVGVFVAVAVLCLGIIVVGKENFWSAIEEMYGKQEQVVSEPAVNDNIGIMLYQTLASDHFAVVDFKITGLPEGEVTSIGFEKVEYNHAVVGESILVRGGIYSWNPFSDQGKAPANFLDPDGNADYLLDISLNDMKQSLDGLEMNVTFSDLKIAYQSEETTDYIVVEGNWDFTWTMTASHKETEYLLDTEIGNDGFSLTEVEVMPASIRCLFRDVFWQEGKEDNRLREGTITNWINLYGIRMEGGETEYLEDGGMTRGTMSWYQEETGEESLIFTTGKFLDAEQIEAVIFRTNEGEQIEVRLEK